ncbi:MAG: sugar ABC transporter permease, partial [Natronospirillum sp.]
LAVLLRGENRTSAVFRTLFFLSQILSVTVVTLIWKLLFSPSQGLIANITMLFGGSPVSWLSSSGFAMAAIVITTVWWSIGIAMVLFLSGLQAIPTEMQEAARLDRASNFQIFWYVLLPNLKRTMTLVIVLQIILHFQVFGQPHLMTNGGPGQQTQTLVRSIYQSAFRDNEMGVASAMAVLLFLIIAAFSAVQFILGREKA